ncbi:MAG: AMP-binding protein, partial [Acidimicrobiia bacterium]
MGDWNFADVWETVAGQIPDAPAQIHGERRETWADFDARANGVAQWLLDLGATEQDKVAQYLYNCPEYLDSLYGALKAGCVPVNTNYRYNEEELLYLWDNADAVAVVFHGAFTERIEPLRNKLDKVKGWLWVDDGSGPCLEWATPFEEVASRGVSGASVQGPWGRSGDHIVMLYTGGTTGMPKGVMWRQDDLIVLLMGALGGGVPEEADMNVIRERVNAPGAIALPACPLMHGTGLFSSFVILSGGGSIVTLTKRNFDVEEFLDTIVREKVFATAIVGDAFAKPMLRALDENPGRWDISSLFAITSSGVMWS